MTWEEISKELFEKRTENKRFERIYADVNIFCRDHNAKGISQLLEKEDYDKIVELLNVLHEENQQLKKENHNRKVLLVDELRGLFQMYLTQCRSISEEAIITMIKRDVKKRVFEVFDE